MFYFSKLRLLIYEIRVHKNLMQHPSNNISIVIVDIEDDSKPGENDKESSNENVENDEQTTVDKVTEELADNCKIEPAQAIEITLMINYIIFNHSMFS